MPTPPRRLGTRLLIIPGLHDSGPAHWQSWIQGLSRDALRVQQDDWATPDLGRWAARIDAAVAQTGDERPLLALCHSFGCLALVRHLHLNPGSPVAAALLVAPADPDKFGVAGLLPSQALPRPSTLVASETDPWMRVIEARRWAGRWGSHWINLGDAGHINAEAGFGPLPLARQWATHQAQRLERGQRPARATLAEWHFAV